MICFKELKDILSQYVSWNLIQTPSVLNTVVGFRVLRLTVCLMRNFFISCIFIVTR